MAETKEEKIAKALEVEVAKLPIGPLEEYGSFEDWLESAEGEKAIRQRVWELCRKLGYTYQLLSLPNGDNNLYAIRFVHGELIPIRGADYFDAEQFTDSELPEKEQDLLLWLADRLAEKGEKVD